MTVGQTVWVAMPYTGTMAEPGGSVYEGTVLAIGERGEVIMQDKHGVHSYGGPFSDSKACESASEAWKHCASVLIQRAEKIVNAANQCEAKAAEVASVLIQRAEKIVNAANQCEAKAAEVA